MWCFFKQTKMFKTYTKWSKITGHLGFWNITYLLNYWSSGMFSAKRKIWNYEKLLNVCVRDTQTFLPNIHNLLDFWYFSAKGKSLKHVQNYPKLLDVQDFQTFLPPLLNYWTASIFQQKEKVWSICKIVQNYWTHVQDFQKFVPTIVKLVDVQYFLSKRKNFETYAKLAKITAHPGFLTFLPTIVKLLDIQYFSAKGKSFKFMRKLSKFKITGRPGFSNLLAHHC